MPRFNLVLRSPKRIGGEEKPAGTKIGQLILADFMSEPRFQLWSDAHIVEFREVVGGDGKSKGGKSDDDGK